MKNRQLSNRLQSFPKNQQLTVDTKEKIETVLYEEILKDEQKGTRKIMKKFVKNSKISIASVATVLLFSLLVISLTDFDFHFEKVNEISGSTEHGLQPDKGVIGSSNDEKQNPFGEEKLSEEERTEEVKNVVLKFGAALKNVSLLAPEDIVKKSIKENYEEFLTPQLLTKWMDDPESALGRLVSSPWPDRIEINNLKKISEYSYEVTGSIIEVTSVEEESGGSAAERPITLTVKSIENKWLIENIVVDDYVQNTEIHYENTDYGFVFSLPGSWEGYQIVTDEWDGTTAESDKVQESGPILIIRHPKWTSETPRQDIPIMIFTISQWDALQQGKFHIGAAPIGPKMLGQNKQYVFALPARYNYAFPEGYEEVEKILEEGPLEAKERK